MTNKKITKRERFEEMVAYFKGIGREDLADFCSHEIELLVKKNAGKSKVSTAEQEKRDAIADAVIDILTNADEPMPNADICKAMPDGIGTLNTQKLTPILVKLVEGGAIEVATVKGRKVFSIA
jgi:hypothetical protein